MQMRRTTNAGALTGGCAYRRLADSGNSDDEQEVAQLTKAVFRTNMHRVGLHNKFPSHFYKRGNLFNTYLGSGEESYRLTPRNTPPPHRRQNGKNPGELESNGEPDQEALIAFVQRFLTLEQMRVWLKYTTEAHNVAPTSERPVYYSVASFVRGQLPPDVCARYLTELERRRDAGLPLVRHR